MSLRKILFSVPVFLLLCGLMFAQTETGAILGTVTDPQGAVVAGAKVTVTNVNTSQERSTMTNSNGLYSITNLQPGDYTVKVDAANFQPTTKRLNVSVGSRNTIDFPLSVSGGTQTVEVVGEGGVAVETQTQSLSSVVSGQQLSELPTRDRNPYSLVQTAGNVSGITPGRGAGVAINGQRDASTDVLLDGGENVDLFVSGVGQNTPLDSVSEFRIITSNFTAEYGRASGGIVNVTTKSGTNAFHGSVFEYYRGAGFTSNSYDNNATMTNDIQNGFCTGVSDPTCSGQKPNYVRNQFGYSVGGPIMKDKLFFFSSTEWQRIRSQGTVNAWILDPTWYGNCANFTASTNPGDTAAAACARVQNFYSTYGTLKPNLKTLQTTTLGSCTGGCPGADPVYDLVQYQVPSDSGGGAPENGYSNVERVDFNWTDRTQMYWRYALQSDVFFPGSVSNNAYVGYDTGQTIFNNNFLWNVTHIWGPNVVTQSKFVFNRLNTVQPLNGPGTPTLDWRSTRATFGPDGNSIFGPGYTPNSPGNGLPFGGPQNLYQFYQDLSWTKGKHQFRFGGQYIHTRDNRVFGAYETSVIGLNTGSSVATANQSLVQGVQRQFQTAIDPQGKLPCPTDQFGLTISTPSCQVTLPVSQPRFDRANRYHDFAFYAEDSWKVASRLTLNLGVRWEYYGVQHNNDPSFDANFFLGSGSNPYEQVRTGTSLTSTDPANPVGGLWTPDYNNWAPRIGFAWDLFGDGKTSLRGGYGIAYERNFGNVTFNVIQNPPSYLVVSSVIGDPGCTGGCPIDVNNLGPLGNPGPDKDLPKGSLRNPIQNMQTAYAHTWSLALEREIAKNTVFALEYSGSKGVKEYTIENINRQAAGPLFLGDNPADQTSGGLPVRKLNDTFSNINQRGQLGYSNYNALNVRVQTNNIHNTGLSFVSNYTWAHGLDNTSSTFSEFGNDFNLGLLNWSIPREDYGDQNFDIRHRWIFSSTWDEPWYKNDASWWKKNILGGWTVAPQINIQSGGPYSLWDCTEAAFNVCPRWFYGAQLNQAAHDVAAPEGNACINFNNDCGGVNTWDYITFDPLTQYFQPLTGGYFNPVAGTSEWGVCGVGEGLVNGCPFPSNMSTRNSFRTPGFWTVNLGVYKTFDITERWKLQLKGESFNLLNHSNLYVNGGSAEADNTYVPWLLGLCTSVADCPAAVTAVRGGHGDATGTDRRTLQLTVKVIF